MSCGNGGSSSGTRTIDTTTTFTVEGPSAVIYRPSGDKLRSLQNAFGEKAFPGILAANNSTLAADSQFLAARGIKVLTTGVSQLRFVKKNGEVQFINLIHGKYAWEIFLFNGLGDPVKADLTDIEAACREAGL
jgi:hypothetical protein